MRNNNKIGNELDNNIILSASFRNEIVMIKEEQPSSNANSGLGLVCPVCGEAACQMIMDGDIIQVPSTLYKSVPCYLSVGFIPCDKCKAECWVVSACFASKELLDREKNSPIGKGFVNHQSELPIETRMMFNCEAGETEKYQCRVEQWSWAGTWTCFEYRLKGKEPFQWHLIGPFPFLENSNARGPYGMANCWQKSMSEFGLGANFLITNWNKFVNLAERRQHEKAV